MAESASTSAGQRQSPRLQLGWMLDALPAKVPVNLRPEGMAAHTAIIAQSGSGKSFMLGRLLEEIASKTQARVVILDSNSDLGQFGAVADEEWKFEGSDSREAFKLRWDRVGFCNLTARPPDSFAEASRSSVSAISLSWPDLPETARASFLELSLRTHPEEYGAFHLRVVCLDLGSLDQPEQRFITATAALDALWVNAREAWTKALASPPDQDCRCPVFVVIDEAHNIAPDESSADAARPTLDILVRIAMEGRKYGLFLILVTQRPARVNSNLMSQCDNLVLMKMSNPADVRLTQDRFGFVPAGWAERALQFKKGQMLLSGQFVERPVSAEVAPRRTVEGGRSLRDAVWLTGPVPAAAEQDAPGQTADNS